MEPRGIARPGRLGSHMGDLRDGSICHDPRRAGGSQRIRYEYVEAAFPAAPTDAVVLHERSHIRAHREDPVRLVDADIVPEQPYEFRFSVRLLRDEIKQYIEHADEHIRFLAQHIYETLENDGADASWFFVFCMSSVRDDLSQWRAYGGGESGVSIGFDPLKIMTDEMRKRGYLVPVRYQPEDHKALANDIAIATLKFFREGLDRRPGVDRKVWADRFFDAWRVHIIYCAPILKDRSFKDEQEWRLIVNLRQEDITRRRNPASAARSYRGICRSSREKLPIREVVVGPCRHPAVSRISVGTYLQAQGYAINEGNADPAKVTVSSSAIPFQSM